MSLNMYQLFALEGLMAARDRKFGALLWDKLIVTIKLMDSLTSLAYAAQIYYPYSESICPYMDVQNCDVHKKLFIVVVVTAISDGVLSMAFSFLNSTWLKGMYSLQTSLHVTNFCLEITLLVCSYFPTRLGMTKGQGGSIPFIVLSAFFTFLTLLATLIGMQRLFVAFKASMTRIQSSLRISHTARSSASQGQVMSFSAEVASPEPLKAAHINARQTSSVP
jgi:hypothetical protein